jgi:mannose-6-phosphate isomerase-like protein (cupin superfamily)
VGRAAAEARVEYPASAFDLHRGPPFVGIAGRLTFTQGKEVYQVRAGDCLRLGPPADCRFENTSGMPCRYLVAVLRRNL